jgi:hypothetical protein
MSSNDFSLNQMVFALTSKGNDKFSIMTHLACMSLRITNPNCIISIACDNQTYETLHLTKDNILSGTVDQWYIIQTPSGSANFRNRFVKTTLRKNLRGSFLFLDSDILVLGDLSFIFKIDADIAGACNHSQPQIQKQIGLLDIETLKVMNWTVDSNNYINGGVLFYRDTELARKFADEWHQRWLTSHSQLNNHRDQPALNSALFVVKPSFYLLPHQYNAQIWANPSTARQAKIWHFYSSDPHFPDTLFDLTVKKILNEKNLKIEELTKLLISKSHPWPANNFIDKIINYQIAKKTVFNVCGWEAAWMQNKMLLYFLRNLNLIKKRLIKTSKNVRMLS